MTSVLIYFLSDDLLQAVYVVLAGGESNEVPPAVFVDNFGICLAMNLSGSNFIR